MAAVAGLIFSGLVANLVVVQVGEILQPGRLLVLAGYDQWWLR